MSSSVKSSGNETPATSESPETSNHPPPSETQTPEIQYVGDKGQDSGVSDQLNVSGSEGEGEGEGEGGEDEEEGECGFCLFMKGGGCRDSFISWEKCVEDAEKNQEDVVEKCSSITAILHKCMEAHADYYEPILRAEKAAEEEVAKELEREAASRESEQETAPKDQQEV